MWSQYQWEQKQLEKQMGFYKQKICELIYALTICRINISIAIIKLSQHSLNPARIHYEDVKNMFVYLNNTKRDWLTYRRIKIRLDLPDKSNRNTISKESTLRKFNQHWNVLRHTLASTIYITTTVRSCISIKRKFITLKYRSTWDST